MINFLIAAALCAALLDLLIYLILPRIRVASGERSKRIRAEEYAQRTQTEPYISLKVFNDADTDLTECYVKLVDLEHFYNPETTLPILEQVNPNNQRLSWGGGSPTEYVTISRGDFKVLNICKSTSMGLVFLFHGHEKSYVGHGRFMARIEIHGCLGGKPIMPIVKEFCFLYGYSAHAERQVEPVVGIRQPITIVVSSAEPLDFADCLDRHKI